ncbi:M81 family metallopeptidase [Aeromicrobium sp. CTD01-1L150]|uniref:M81 family metallopeptidase n=1 Tax=Aeromicrobium sp. CTD01-1L150 TaxID=3341830 RepID=UPI0035C0BD34
MRVLVSEFRQESNSFTPITSSMDFWRQNGLLEGEAVVGAFAGTQCAIGGMIEALQESEHRTEVTYAITMSCQSGGTAEQQVMDYYLDRLLPEIERNLPLDAVLLSFHGALQTTECDDPEALIARRVRELVGDECVIAASTDLHGYITEDLVRAANYVCAYHTYPHVDYVETGRRTAELALAAAAATPQEPFPVTAWVPIPMVVSASAYNTRSGPFKALMERGKALVADGTLRDFSIYQMQPWLDVPDGHSAVLAVADTPDVAAEQALELAAALYSHRHDFATSLWSIDDVIDRAASPDSAKPVILVDSADSCNAGAPGDSMAVPARLLELDSGVKAAAVVNDTAAAHRAHELGVGARGTFRVGASRDTTVPFIEAEGYVKSLHDGVFSQEGPAGRGMVQRIGPTAVLSFGSLDVVVCEWMAGNGDPQLFRAHGVEPTLYDLVAVKANTSFRAAYEAFAGEICETDTPGSAAPSIDRLPFRRLPRTLYPWTDAPKLVKQVVHGPVPDSDERGPRCEVRKVTS